VIRPPGGGSGRGANDRRPSPGDCARTRPTRIKPASQSTARGPDPGSGTGTTTLLDDGGAWPVVSLGGSPFEKGSPKHATIANVSGPAGRKSPSPTSSAIGNGSTMVRSIRHPPDGLKSPSGSAAGEEKDSGSQASLRRVGRLRQGRTAPEARQVATHRLGPGIVRQASEASSRLSGLWDRISWGHRRPTRGE
jgi:hypothetical protein